MNFDLSVVASITVTLHWALSTGYDLIYVWRHLQAATSGKCLTGHPHLRCPQEAVRNATIPILGKADMTYWCSSKHVVSGEVRQKAHSTPMNHVQPGKLLARPVKTWLCNCAVQYFSWDSSGPDFALTSRVAGSELQGGFWMESEDLGWSRIPKNTMSWSRILLSDSDTGSLIEAFFTSHY